MLCFYYNIYFENVNTFFIKKLTKYIIINLADFIGYLEKIIFVNLIRKIDLLTNSIHILIIARLISPNAKDTPFGVPLVKIL